MKKFMMMVMMLMSSVCVCVWSATIATVMIFAICKAMTIRHTSMLMIIIWAISVKTDEKKNNKFLSTSLKIIFEKKKDVIFS